jgi:plasmid stability protein
MAQALIRNLEDELLAAYREAARRNNRSLEAELRDALRRAQPLSAGNREAALAKLADIRALTPRRHQTPSEQLVREDRDGH